MIIYYRAGYKYQLTEDFSVHVNIRCGETITTPYIRLSKMGCLVIKSGYAWDGPSGPAIDSKTYMRASLAHDALYELFRSGELSIIYRKRADRIFYDLCLADGMWKIRAWIAYKAVRRFATRAALFTNKADLPSLPESKNLLLAAQKQLLELPLTVNLARSPLEFEEKFCFCA